MDLTLPPGAAMERVMFDSLLRLFIDDLNLALQGSVYRELACVQWARTAAHHARNWHPHLRGDDEPLPNWVACDPAAYARLVARDLGL